MRHLFLSIFLGVLTLQSGHAYRTDISYDKEEDFCAYRQHLTFKPNATCCAHKLLSPGIDIGAHWKKCSSSITGKAHTLAETAWNLYGCIVKTATQKSELTLQEFSDVMTQSYPAEIKSKIDEEIKTVSSLSASVKDFVALEKLRVTYFDIEEEVCTGMNTETKSYGKIEACSSWKEENHRAGMCCKTSYPVDIRYKSLLDISLSPELAQSCRDALHPELKMLNASETMENNLMEICDAVCAMAGEGQIDLSQNIIKNLDYWHINFEKEIGQRSFLPRYYPNALVSSAMSHAISTMVLNDTIEAMQNYEFADVILGDSNTLRPQHETAFIREGNKTDKFKTEFLRRKFHHQIIHVPILCSMFREAILRMEHFLFQDCAPIEVTEASVDPPAVETEAPPPSAEVTEPAPSEDVTEPAPSGDATEETSA